MAVVDSDGNPWPKGVLKDNFQFLGLEGKVVGLVPKSLLPPLEVDAILRHTV